MPPPTAAGGLWTWCVGGRVDAARLRTVLAEVLRSPVVALDVPAPAPGAVLCDVWYSSGDFPTVVDCYLAPSARAEIPVVAAVARRLDRRCLLPDDTLNPTRYLLIDPAGTLRPVHVDITETDDGEAWSNLRPCTMADPWCREVPGCGRSRWAPDSVLIASA